MIIDSRQRDKDGSVHSAGLGDKDSTFLMLIKICPTCWELEHPFLLLLNVTAEPSNPPPPPPDRLGGGSFGCRNPSVQGGLSSLGQEGRDPFVCPFGLLPTGSASKGKLLGLVLSFSSL